jgi:hypothetical protein
MITSGARLFSQKIMKLILGEALPFNVVDVIENHVVFDMK